MRNYVAAAMTFLAIDAVGSAVLSPRAHAADPVSECAPGVRVDLKTPLPTGITPAGCATLVLDPGMRPKLNITGHTGGVQGVLALRCKEPGTCIFATGSVVANVDGFILDGVQIRGGSNGLTIKASKNVLIQRSIFQEQTSSGVLINPGTMNINIQIYNNQFINSLRGCNYLNSDVCDFLPDGSPVSQMDYGLRVYSADQVDVQRNTFGTTFNHAISLKSLVTYATITNNTFNSCGRTCIELGQDSPACGEALVDSNTFKGSRLLDVNINNINKATVTNNTFFATAAKIRIQPRTPETRVIVTSPNKLQ